MSTFIFYISLERRCHYHFTVVIVIYQLIHDISYFWNGFCKNKRCKIIDGLIAIDWGVLIRNGMNCAWKVYSLLRKPIALPRKSECRFVENSNTISVDISFSSFWTLSFHHIWYKVRINNAFKINKKILRLKTVHSE